MAESVSVEISIEDRAALRALTRLTKQTKGFESQAKTSFGSFAAGGRAAGIAMGAAAAGVAALGAGVVVVGKNSIEAAREMEVLTTQLKVVLGSADAAQKQMEDLSRFAANTPFQIQDLALSTRQLLSFGVAQSEVIPKLKILGDLAAATGSDISELTIPFGRLVSTQKLTLVELDKFADRGINLYGKLAEQTGISLKVIRDEISKGRVPFEEFTRALSDLTGEGGMFFGAMEQQSRTLDGAFSNLADNSFILAAEIGKIFSPSAIAGAKALSDLIGEMAEGIRGFVTQDIGEVNAEIAQLSQTLSKIQENVRANEGKTLYNSIFGRADEDQAEIERITNKLKELRAIRDGMVGDAQTSLIDMNRGADTNSSPVAASAAPIDPRTDPRVMAEMTVQAEIRKIRQEAALVEEEQKLLEKEAQGIATEGDIERLQEINRLKVEIEREFQDRMAELKFSGEELRLQKEKNAEQASLANLRTGSQARIEQIKKEALAKKESDQVQVASERLKTQAISGFIGTGISLMREGAKEQQALASIQAAFSTYSAINQALGNPPGPPFTIGLAASIGAQGFANVAKINGLAFANGGFVGGAVGASVGADNRLATIRDGEMLLNGQQQRTVLDAVTNGFPNQQAPMDNRPIVIEIDGIEVARAVRDARKDGFEI